MTSDGIYLWANYIIINDTTNGIQTYSSETTYSSGLDIDMNGNIYIGKNFTGTTTITGPPTNPPTPPIINSYTGNTLVDVKENLFSIGDWVYIEDFYFLSGGTIMKDLSGLYLITAIPGDTNGTGLNKGSIQIVIKLNIDNLGLKLMGTPKMHYYKGLKISVTRIDESDISDINHRYLVTKEFLTSEMKNPY